ncbi:hypothetical protein MKY15_15710 [Sporosarcina sp. FSL K6-1540]|uniref:hypothetical protein n=1 Tax=Sporosarcina sp. FSL K6-1540 TaxID=2921555 RepID=UPI00315A699B
MKHCIYFKKTEPDVTFISEEHIFPAGIGGIQKLPLKYVSHNCNNAFSAMELPFMRNSLIALPRQFYGPGKRGNLNPKNATKSSVSLMNGVNDPKSIEFGYISLGQPYSIPQLKFKLNGTCHFTSDSSLGDVNKQTSDFIKLLEKFKGKYKLFENEQLSQHEFIVGYSENNWYVALSNTDLENEVSSFIEKFLEQKPFENQSANFGTIQPNVIQTIQFDDRYYRVCAKIIFNYLAFVKGQAFVLENCFDPLREWIVNGGENKFAGLLGKEASYSIPFPELSHNLFIIQDKKVLKGIISFYGGAFETQVNLCDDFEGYFEMDGFICDWKNRKEFRFDDYVNTLTH